MWDKPNTRLGALFEPAGFAVRTAPGIDVWRAVGDPCEAIHKEGLWVDSRPWIRAIKRSLSGRRPFSALTIVCSMSR